MQQPYSRSTSPPHRDPYSMVISFSTRVAPYRHCPLLSSYSKSHIYNRTFLQLLSGTNDTDHLQTLGIFELTGRFASEVGFSPVCEEWDKWEATARDHGAV
jgi:hypothetical protein